MNVVELVEYVARSLVDHPERIEVRRVDGQDAVTIELRVSPEDMGKVIGKQGRIAKAIRTVVRAATTQEPKPVFLEIV